MKTCRVVFLGTVAGALGLALHRASRGGVRDSPAVQHFYDRLAPAYDVAAWPLQAYGTATAIFGVTRAYEDIQPWRSVRRHLDEIAFETAMGGALYLIVAQAPKAV